MKVVSAGECETDEIDLRTAIARVICSNMGHLWCRNDVGPGLVCNASARAVSLDVCETWPLRDEDVKTVFDHHCLRKIADIQWKHHVSDFGFRRPIFGHSNDNSIDVTILKYLLQWFGHVLRISFQRT